MQRAVAYLVEELNEKSTISRRDDKKMERIEAGLSKARASIKDAILKSRYSPPLAPDTDYVPRGEIYHNAYVFQSVVMILQHLFDPVTRDKGVLERVVGDYVHIVSTKYPYWNRSLGADHFMLSCHDWGPRATWYEHHLYFTSMRVLCNANTSEFFNPRKDVSFPEINLRTGDLTGLTSGSSNRTILAFFAGRLHGRIRPALFQHWKDKDSDVKVYEKLPENSPLSYKEMMERSKYCLCPSGYEVASPRVCEAIYAECVPVLISENYVLPFSDVLDWDKFSIKVSVRELPELKRILMGIGDDKYKALHRGVKQVQRHFMVNDPPKRYDVFHMMIHSLWLRRLNLRINA
ncbi:UNVERIFIED_CONTAM: putative glycosyltransferase [Sesamum radiatum]|uniref:Glycosyltransferase n=1 Tax=Sesamum radiatum TaxID=300843 RepID=A0AAW2LNX0_SESRA